MINWDRLSEWLAAAILASLTWFSGSISLEEPAASVPMEPTAERLMIGWAQDASSPPIEQVGEGPGDDAETLDEGGTAPDVVAGDDPETLDSGAPPAALSDEVETLDQGVPAAAAQPVDAIAPAPTADAAPATTAVEPAAATASGPSLPEGFGTGQVFALAGRGEAPIGLADCQVGAVTGRAYVGLDCGEDDGTSFVGHVRSFESFPFVLEAEFPFEGDEAFFTDANFPFGEDDELTGAASRDTSAETNVIVSARGGQRARDDEVSNAPVIETGGESRVSFAQRARDREPRVRVENRSGRDDSGKKRARGESERETVGVASQQRSRGDNGTSEERNKEAVKEAKGKDKKGKKERAKEKARKRNRG